MENPSVSSDTHDVPEPNPADTIEAMDYLFDEVNRHLDVLVDKVQALSTKNFISWMDRVQSAKQKISSKGHIIGVVGATGAGKSALINAVLDEERLVPTSCVQACTAAVIEIAYNQCDKHEYRAVVEFVSRKFWHAEIDLLIKDTLSTTGSLDRGLGGEESEACRAFGKITAVYPDLNISTLAKATPEELTNRPGLEVLDSSIELTAATADELYEKLRKYVENRKDQGTLSVVEQPTSSETLEVLEYWPLVRKVKVYTKSSALKTGCVLVDLPGVADANAARSAIAREYLPKCASLWVVAPITRAVDDKIARKLLGENFKRQVRRDGAIDRVAFICSKSDEGLIKELRQKFSEESSVAVRMTQTRLQIDQCEEAKLNSENKIQRLQSALQLASHQIKGYELEISAHKNVFSDAQGCTLVDPLILLSTKRPHEADETLVRKQQKTGDYSRLDTWTDASRDQEGGIVKHHSESSRQNSFNQDLIAQSLDVDRFQFKVSDLTRAVDKSRKYVSECEAQVKQQQKALDNTNKCLIALRSKEWDLFHHARNEYVTKRIRSDFQDGLRDLEIDERMDEDDYDPDIEITGSTQQNPIVPVFCVSSQYFQKLRGRLEQEFLSNRFDNAQQTGIPDLVRFCHQIGGSQLEELRKYKMVAVCGPLDTLKTWLTARDNDIVLSTGNKIAEPTKDLFAALTEQMDTVFSNIQDRIKLVNANIKEASITGQNKAVGIVRRWGASRAADQPGLPYQTYRAVARREGKYDRPDRDIDWAQELMHPVHRAADSRWDLTFNTTIPNILESTTGHCTSRIVTYLEKASGTDEFVALSDQQKQMFVSQCHKLKDQIVKIISHARTAFETGQRNANRQFDGYIREALKPILAECDKDSGTGVFKRIKEKMEVDMKSSKRQMFDNGAQKVIDALQALVERIQRDAGAELKATLDTFRQDCQFLFDKDDDEKEMSIQDRDSIRQTISEIESLFGMQGLMLETTLDQASSKTSVKEDSVPPAMKQELSGGRAQSNGGQKVQKTAVAQPKTQKTSSSLPAADSLTRKPFVKEELKDDSATLAYIKDLLSRPDGQKD